MKKGNKTYVLLFLLALVSPRGADSQFEMLTQERISMLPEGERRSWMDYLDRSQQLADREQVVLLEEFRSVGNSKSDPAPGNSREFEPDRDTQANWYSSDEANRMTETVLSDQTPSGGWSKAIDYSRGPRPKGTHWTSQSGAGWHYCGTLDNRSTTEQIRFLARVYPHSRCEDAKRAVKNGLEWLFKAQYPNGGWPQNYSVESDYHEAITLNDDATLHTMELLLDVADGAEPFQFAEDSLRDRARLISKGSDLPCQNADSNQQPADSLVCSA